MTMTPDDFTQQRAAIAAHRFAWREGLQQALEDCTADIALFWDQSLNATDHHDLACLSYFTSRTWDLMDMKRALLALLNVDGDKL
jgi:hypothetical protein